MSRAVPQRSRLQVHEYEFSLHVTKGQVQLRFPCTFFLTWRSGKHTVQDIESVAPSGSTIPFNSRLDLTCEIAYNELTQTYLQKRSFISVFLNSQTRSSQPRLVGVVPVDLSNCLNGNTYDFSRAYPIERCPDRNSSLTFNIRSRFVRELDRDEARDLSFSFQQQDSILGAEVNFNQPQSYGSSGITYGERIGNQKMMMRRNIPTSDVKAMSEYRSPEYLQVQHQEPILARSHGREQQFSSPTSNYLNIQSPQPPRLTRSQGVQDSSPQPSSKPSPSLGIQSLKPSSKDQSKSQKHSRARKQRQLWMAKMQTTVINRRNEIKDKEFQQELAKYKGKAEKLIIELECERGLRRNVEMELENARAECKSYKALNKDFQKKLMELKSMEEDLKVMRGMKESLDVAERKVSCETQKVDDLMRQLQQLRMENSKLNMAFTEMQISKYVDPDNANSLSKKSKSEVQKDKKNRGFTTELKGDDIQDLKVRLEESELVYDKVKNRMLDTEDKLRKVQSDLRIKKKEAQQYAKKLQEQMIKYEQLQNGQKTQLTENLETLKKGHTIELEARQELIRQLKNQVATLKTALQQNHSIFETRQDSLFKDFLRTEQQYRNKIEQLSSSKEALLEKVAQLEQKLRNSLLYPLPPILEQRDSQTHESPNIPTQSVLCLQAEIIQLKQSLDLIRKKESTEKADFERDLEKERSEKQILEVELARLSSQREVMTNSLKDLERQHSSISALGQVISKQDFLQLKKLESELEENAKASKQKIQLMESELAEKQEAIEKILAQNLELQNQLEDRQAKLDEYVLQKEKLNQFVRELEEKIAMMNEDQNHLASLPEKQALIKHLTEKNKDLEQYLPTLQDEIASLQNQFSTLEKKLTETLKAYAQATSKIEQINAQNEQYVLNERLLRESLQDMEMTCNQLYQQMKERDQNEMVLQETVRDLELKVRKSRQGSSVGNSPLKDLTVDAPQPKQEKVLVDKCDIDCSAHIQPEINVVCDQCPEYKLVQMYLEQRLTKAQKQNKEYQEMKCKSMVSKSKVAVKMMSAAIRTQSKQVDSIQNKLLAAEKQIVRLNDELQKAKNELFQYHQTLKHKQVEEADLKLVLNFLQQKGQKLNKEKQQLQQQNFKAKSSVSSAQRASRCAQQAKRSEVQRIVKKLSMQMINLSFEKNNLEKELRKRQTMILPLKAMKQQQTQTNELVEKNNYLEDSVFQYKKKQENYIQQLSDLKEELQEQSDKHTKQVEELNQQICRQFSDHNTKDLKIDELTEKVSYLEQCLKTFESQFQVAKNMIRDYEERLEKKESEDGMTYLKNQIAKLVEENTVIKRQNEVYVKLIQSSSQSVSPETLQLRRQVQQLAKQCSNLEKINQTLQQKVLASRITQSPISRPAVADFQHGGIIWESQMGDVQQMLIVYTTRNRLLAERLRIVTADRIRLEERARELVIEVGRVKAKWLAEAESLSKKKEVLDNMKSLEQVSEAIVGVLEGVDQAMMTEQSSEIDLRDVEDLGQEESEV